MSKLSNDAFAVMAMCDRNHEPYGITVDKVSQGHYRLVWAFKINADKAKREGYDQTSVKGSIELDKDYPGCPYCKAKDFVVCGSCKTIVCYHGGEHFTCPKCNASGDIVATETFDLKGGGY